MSSRQPKGIWRKGRVIVCWFLFAAGLLVQLVSPHLKISNRTFVIPHQTLSVAGKTTSPEEIIRKQRLMQLLSAVLTASGALGLAFHYRNLLFGRTSREVVESMDFPNYRHSDDQ